MKINLFKGAACNNWEMSGKTVTSSGQILK